MQNLNLLLIPLLLITTMNAQTLVDFKTNPSTQNWYVIDDVVMGGRSSGKFSINADGYGQFSGTVSLENNGGFSSVRFTMAPQKVSPKSKIRIRLKGDGNRFQFRVRDEAKRNYSYFTRFDTTGDWQTLEFQLSDLYPVFRGRRLDLPNFNHTTLEELGFLIGNKQPQEFQLVLDTIELIHLH